MERLLDILFVKHLQYALYLSGLVLLALAAIGRVTSPLRRVLLAVIGLSALGLGAWSSHHASSPQASMEEMEKSLRPWPVTRPATVPRSSLEFRLVLDQAGAGTATLRGPEGTSLILAPDAVITQRDITRVEVGRGLYGPDYVVYVHFTPDAAQRLLYLSRDNTGRRLACVISDRIFMAPKITGAVSSPILIQGTYTQEEATQMAERLAP